MSLAEMAGTNVEYPTVNYGVDWQSLQGGLASMLGGGGKSPSQLAFSVQSGMTMPESPGRPAAQNRPLSGLF